MKIEKLTSTDIVDENFQKLKQLFPTAFREGKVVMEELQALLGDYVEKEKEYYEMSWAGKSTARQEANKMSTGTLRPAVEESKDWEETENVFIEGDNLEVLKLLQKSYSDKVKLIYIDPPYNTGKDFVYKDNYKDNLSHYLELSGQTDDLGRRLSTNTESDGRYHSNWLNMMYPRLMLARNLLTEDGVIFISIDDNEQANLKKLCDEIFGEENFYTSIIIRSNSRGRTYNQVAKTHEYIYIYIKSDEGDLLELEKDEKNSDLNLKDKIGSFNIRELRNRNPKFGKHNRPNLFYPIFVDPRKEDEDGFLPVSLVQDDHFIEKVEPFNSNGDESCWRWASSRFLLNNKKNTQFSNVVAKQKNTGEYGVYEKYRKTTYKVKSIWSENRFLTERGTVEMKELGFSGEFDFPKPVSLIKRCIELCVNENDIILDFFAGSGTTAHAVMQLNAEDGGSRKCICVQLPEPTDEKSQAYQAGYTTIAEISKERIRRAGRQIIDDQEDEFRKKKEKLEKSIGRELIRQESDDGDRYEFPEGVLTDDSVMSALDDLNDHCERLQKLDTGFRVFKLDSSNIVAWDTTLDSFEGQLEAFDENDGEHIKRGRSEEDVLYEILLKYGLELTEPILEKECGGANVYNIGYGSMYICLAERIDRDVAVGIGEWHKEFSDEQPAVIFRDSGFPSDAAKTNAVQTLRQWGIDNVSSI